MGIERGHGTPLRRDEAQEETRSRQEHRLLPTHLVSRPSKKLKVPNYSRPDLSTYAATESSSDEEIDSDGTPAKQDSPRSPTAKE